MNYYFFNSSNIEDIFSDLIDHNFEYGGITQTYKYDPKNQWQEQIRTLPNGSQG